MSSIVKQVVDEHNLIRTNPQFYIPFIEKEMSYLNGSTLEKPGEIPLMTNEGKAAYQECIKFLKNQKPLSKLEHNDKLSRASQDHADDIGPRGACSHNGSDGSSTSDRIERYIQWQNSCAENISFGQKTARDVIIQLIVDDGLQNRIHRSNVFSADSKFIGVGFQNHRDYKTCCVIDYVGGIVGQQNSNLSNDYEKDSTGEYNQPNHGGIDWSSFKPQENEIDDDSNFSNNIGTKCNKSKNIGFDRFGEFENNSRSRGISAFNNKGFDDFENFGFSNIGNQRFSNQDLYQGFGNFGGNEDPDRPKNAVSSSVKTVTQTINGRTVRKSIKTYTMSDGSQQTIETEDKF